MALFNNSRRIFLKWMGLSGHYSPANGVLAGQAKDLDAALIKAALYFADQVNLELLRYQDLLQINLSFTGFKRSTDGKSLVRSSSSALLIVLFQPHPAPGRAGPYREQGWSGRQPLATILDATASADLQEPAASGNDPLSFPAGSFLADRSRLSFNIPASITTIALTAGDLLDWSRFTPVINRRATAPASVPVFTSLDNIADYNNPIAVESAAATTAAPAMSKRKQAQLNKDLRAATLDEQQQITGQNLPKGAKKPAPVKAGPGIIQRITPGKTPRPLDISETSIELPYRLFISPNQYAAWLHETTLRWMGTSASAPVSRPASSGTAA